MGGVGGLISSDKIQLLLEIKGSGAARWALAREWGQTRRQSAGHTAAARSLRLENLQARPLLPPLAAAPLAFAATIPSRMAPEAEASQVLRRSAAS